MVFRADDIRDTLAVGTYPYTLRFLAQEQIAQQRFYPSIEVINVNPEGSRESFDITQDVNTVEIRVFVKYNFKLDTETQNLHDIETQISTLLKAASLSNNLELASSFRWARTQILDNPHNVHGIQSTLRLTITEVKSTSGLGNIGGSSTISLGALSDIPFLDKPAERETEINENIYNTARQRKALSPITDVHTFLGEIEYTKARMDELRTLKRNKAVITPITYKRPGVADEVFSGKIVEISNPAPFNNIETIIFQIERLS